MIYVCEAAARISLASAGGASLNAAGFGLVSTIQFRRTRCKQSCCPKQVTQHSVGEFSCAQGTQQTMLLQLQLEATVTFLHV